MALTPDKTYPDRPYPDEPSVILPTRDDPLLATSAEFLGGPAGIRVRVSSGWWTPLRVVVGLAVVGFLGGYLTKMSCMSSGWTNPGTYTHLCYSDIPPLFSLRGFADNAIPYLTSPGASQQYLEYPVLTGVFMWIASIVTPDGDDQALWFFNINTVMLAACFLVAVLATSLTVRRRPWDGAMVALAPVALLTATINWDLLAVALLALSLALWARNHVAASGVVLGLAAGAKFYPFLILLPVLLLCLRSGKLRQFAVFLGCTVGAWLVVNLPFMFINFAGWSTFYTFSADRGEDFGSLWLVLTQVGWHVGDQQLNSVATGLFLLGCVGIVILALGARRRPRLAALCFLVVAAFLVTNKVYSPQYVLWLVPLAVLARPRWRDFLIWQAGQLVYFIAIWWYLAGLSGSKGLPIGWYSVAIVIQIAATLWFAAMIIRDIYKPHLDPIRSDRCAEDDDDPGGGIFNHAADSRHLRLLHRSPRGAIGPVPIEAGPAVDSPHVLRGMGGSRSSRTSWTRRSTS